MCEFDSDKPLSADDIVVAFWTEMPSWIDALFRLRHVLVKPFGLSGGEENGMDKEEFERCIRNGENSSWIAVSDKSPAETILQLDDKHLCAYLSVYVESLGNNHYKAYLTTIVKFKYWLGYVYFYTIYPFHHLVVKSMLRHVMKRLTSL